jgi:DNA (cytosine-5)-methyltransferase 1
MGYHYAGFDVLGVDLNPQPHNPWKFNNHFSFMQCDARQALEILLRHGLHDVVAIHASPPCQTHSTLKTVRTRHVDDLIVPIREMLQATGLPYVIENVEGAPLIDPVRFCGTATGCTDSAYELRRHRLFEANWDLHGTACGHERHRQPVGVYGHLGNHVRPNRPESSPTGPHGYKASKSLARSLMGIFWTVTDHELAEAIPPAYTRSVGLQLTRHLERNAA